MPPWARGQHQGRFFYLFPDATPAAKTGMTASRLDALAENMVESNDDKSSDSLTLPPIIPFLGQFIDHDIIAATDGGTGVAGIDGQDVTPVDRGLVEAGMGNLRTGWLRLDSLYGGGSDGEPFAQVLTGLMRQPEDVARMRVGCLAPADGGAPAWLPLPPHAGADLLRLGQLLVDGGGPIALAELQSLPVWQRRLFLSDKDTPIIQRAIIGDTGNDENLIVAQLHLAFLKLHNRLIERRENGDAAYLNRNDLHRWARRQLTWTFQWLVLNAFLPAVCGAGIARQVCDAGAPLYSALIERHGCHGGAPPVPLEFSAAAFRFVQPMLRAAYDYNRHFGAPVDGLAPSLPYAPLELLFRFTGSGVPSPMPRPDGGSYPALPSNWVIEWERFVHPPDLETPHRAARRIDTALSQTQSIPPGFKGFGWRNLRRGLRLNIPSGQDCVAGVNACAPYRIELLSRQDLIGGRTGPAIADGLGNHTPLWFYVLKEAELQSNGECLGPLGATLVADTIAGLVINDPSSYWHAPGSDGGRWHPRDGPQPSDEPINSLAAFLRSAHVL